jgi:hypothetical protein
MGFRTTIILNNDLLEDLVTKPNIGKDIHDAVLRFGYGEPGNVSFGPLGDVVEQSHADFSKLAIIGAGGSFDIDVLAVSCWNDKEAQLDMLKIAADKLGYKLIKKSNKIKKKIVVFSPN